MSWSPDVSIVMPYWERSDAARRGIDSIWRMHARGPLKVEIVLVDDGSPTDPARAIDFAHPWVGDEAQRNPNVRLKLIELPVKPGPLNPCVPINRGVAAAGADFILLTNPETTLRDARTIPRLLSVIADGGPKIYALAAAWCPEVNWWHCHGVHASAGYHFFSMLTRRLWDDAGGFDEDYRDGACYDDPDFVERLLRAGARFRFCDDVVVDHHKSGATIDWPRPMWDRNRDLFFRKWPHRTDGSEAKLQNWRGQ